MPSVHSEASLEEAIHTHAYQYCIESLGMDEGEIFNMYHEIPSVAKKASWGLKYTQSLSNPEFKTGTTEDDQDLLKNLIAFYCCLEASSFTAALHRFSPWAGVIR